MEFTTIFDYFAAHHFVIAHRSQSENVTELQTQIRGNFIDSAIAGQLIDRDYFSEK